MVVIHVGRPWSMIDFAQESGRAGRGGEMVDSIILAEQKGVEQQLMTGQLSIDVSAVANMMVTPDCRRFVMSEYLDGIGRGRRCTEVEDGARCDCCGEGLTGVMIQKRQMARAWRRLEKCLDEMTTGCAVCWLLTGSEVGTTHSISRCEQWAGLTEAGLSHFRRQIRYARKVRSCHRCGIDQRWCATGQDPQLFFSAKGTKLHFKSTLLNVIERFESYLADVLDLTQVDLSRLYVDIGRGICPRVSLLASQVAGLDEQPQVYSWKRCCLEEHLQRMYDRSAPAVGGRRQRYYD